MAATAMLLFAWADIAMAQSGAEEAVDQDSSRVERSRGLQVLLTNSGFGLGAYTGRSLGTDLAIQLEASLAAVKDEREVAFFDRFGRRDVPNKANYLIEIPILLNLERQVFSSRIENNFRPFLSISAGPLLGWVYPYFDDENANGRLDDGESTFDVVSGISEGALQSGVAGSISFGARFGTPGQSGYGVRFGYRFSRFSEPIALLEEEIKAPERFYGTPIILLYFGTLGF